MDLQDALQAAIEHRIRLEHDRKRIDEQLAEIEVEVRGLRMALQRHVGAEAAHERVPGLGASSLTRTDAILHVLRRAGGPMSPNEIQVALHELGRDDEYNAVSAAVAHLAKTSRAHSIGRGQWLAGPEASATDNGASEILRRVASGEAVMVKRTDGRKVRLRRHDQGKPTDADPQNESEAEAHS